MESETENYSQLKTVENLIDLLKVLGSLFTTAIWPILSWRDPTFFGLLAVNRDFGKPLLKWVAFVSVSVMAVQLSINWGFWGVARTKRKISQSGLRVTLVSLFLGVPAMVFLFNVLTSHFSDHPRVRQSVARLFPSGLIRLACCYSSLFDLLDCCLHLSFAKKNTKHFEGKLCQG
jgi:hypothetical protein